MQLTELSDDALVSQLAAICLEGHRLTARLIECLIEVEDRRLDLKAACTSMFDFCVRRLRMSEGAAFRRINAARLVKRFPALLERIASGELHLSTLVLLRPHLVHADAERAATLAAAARGKTQREVEELLARMAPRPDVPSAIVELPRAPVPQLELERRDEPVRPTPMPARVRIEPLSEARFKVQLTASTELRDKLERARDLMSHANPGRDLAVVVERALDLLLERLEEERLAKVKRPARRATIPKRSEASRTVGPRVRAAVPRAIRREVFERDGERCTFVDAEGCRCPSRAHLELDHAHSHALGGADDAANLRVRCRAHNRLHAEEVFGKEHVASAIDFRQRKSRRLMNAETPPAVDDVALRGLVTMGFARPDAQRALGDIARRRQTSGETLPVQEILREAIAALT